MEFMVNIDLKRPSRQINYRDRMLLVGSCFTEHIGNSLEELKFSVVQNPNGILFDPYSVGRSLISYAQNKKYSEEDFFQLNEVWHSWEHHSRFSNTNLGEAVRIINQSSQTAHDFLKQADWLVITLGSAFSYRLTEQGIKAANSGKSHFATENFPVANCHRAPAQWFRKYLMPIEEVVSILEQGLKQSKQLNPKLNIIFTVSPVRHIRDGVIDNNRSKARLIEAVHYLVNKNENQFYFPAYELVIDVLRDYRFYDVDLVHPNFMATEFVLEKFAQSCIDQETQELMREVKSIVIARKHRAFQPQTNAHKEFLASYFKKTTDLQSSYPFLNLQEEIAYFSPEKETL